MKWQLGLGSIALAICAIIGSDTCVIAQYAVEVVSYDLGTTPALEFGTNAPFNIPSAALGQPELLTGEGSGFPSVVSAFSPPYLRDEVLSVGEGGWLTLRFSNYVIPQTVGPEIGVFTNAGLADSAWPNGQAASPAMIFGSDRADVEVSEYGNTWTSMGNVLFDLPTNAYTDLDSPYSSTGGDVLADFQQPFTGMLSDLDGLPYADPGNPDILNQLDGSGGGTWLDISGLSLSQIGYIRFRVADDNDTNTRLNFELDAVSIATSAVGALTIPEPNSIGLLGLAGLFLTWRFSVFRKP